MSNLPLVSIIIPVYNGGAWLQEAIDSALAQTWLNLEVVVVDDGSTDDGWTRRVAESYGDQIRFFHKPNGGVASALNLGVAEMRGAFFSWLSHDDRYKPEKVEQQMRVMLAQSEPAIVFGDAILVDKDGRKLRPIPLAEGIAPADHPLWWVLEGRLSGCALLIPKVCFDACGRFSEHLPTTQDYDLWYRFAKRYKFVPAPGYFVESRTHEQQGSRLERHLTEAAALWTRMLEEILDSHVDQMAPSEIAFLERFRSVSGVTTYPGVAARLEALIAAQRKRTRITLAVDVQAGDMDRAIGALQDAGYHNLDLVFVDCPARANPARIATIYPRIRQLGTLLTLPANCGLHCIAAHVRAAAKSSVVVFYQASSEAGLAEQILAVDAGAAVAWPGQPAATSSLFAGLAGAVVQVPVLQRALEFTRRADVPGLGQALALADFGDWRETWRRRPAVGAKTGWGDVG